MVPGTVNTVKEILDIGDKMRRKLIAGNWKMYKNMSETSQYLNELGSFELEHAEAVLCVPFTNIIVLRDFLGVEGDKRRLPLGIGSQNMCCKMEGAMTGEVSPPMLVELSVEYAIIGHSERRTIFKESEEMIMRKARAAHDVKITPIICVGENYEQYNQGETADVVKSQIESALSDLSADEVAVSVIAYEPIWAIGTANAATPEEANEVIALIRKYISQLYGGGVADKIRILYGGSVNAENLGDFLAQSDIDGALIGGASLQPATFLQMLEIADSLNDVCLD